MSTNFDAVELTDAVNGMCNSEFAEDVSYTPLNGVARTISAEVVRHPLDTPPEITQGLTDAMTITVANDSTAGIALSTFNSGGDTITLAYRVGGTAAAYLLPPPASMTAGLLTFVIGKQ